MNRVDTSRLDECPCTPRLPAFEDVTCCHGRRCCLETLWVADFRPHRLHDRCFLGQSMVGQINQTQFHGLFLTFQWPCTPLLKGVTVILGYDSQACQSSEALLCLCTLLSREPLPSIVLCIGKPPKVKDSADCHALCNPHVLTNMCRSGISGCGRRG